MIRIRHILIALGVSALFAVPAEAQTGTVRARAVDAGSRAPLPSVAVALAGRTELSDADGRVVFAGVPVGTYVVRFTRVGYRAAFDTVAVTAGGVAEIEIPMQIVAVQLEMVVISGYGEQMSKDLTGVIQAVSSEEFNPGRVISPEELIQAKVPGVRVVDSGEPGGGISIRIRGGTSVTSSNEPLFVLDGMPLSVGGGISAGRNPLNFINADDVESITVLKDASATAIYGSRGANGVVIIETKGGTSTAGRQGSQLSYTGTVSGSVIDRVPEMLTVDQFKAAVQQYAPSSMSLLGSENTDWRGAIQRTGVGQEHNVSFAGATDDLDYRLSLGYLSQGGVIRRSKTEKTTVGLGFRHRFFDGGLQVTADLRGARLNDDFTPGVIGAASIFAPTQPIEDANSPYGGYFEWYDYATALNNPVAALNLTTDYGTTYRTVGDVEAEFDIPFVPGLTANMRFGYDATKAERQTFQPTYLRGQAESGLPGFVSRSNATQANALFDVFSNYSHRFESLRTDFDFTGGYSYETSNAEYPYFEAQGLSFDYLSTAGIPAADQYRETIFVDESRLISFFGRAHFTMADRYLLTLSLRRDGSSKFGPDEQWGMFPSAAFAWRLSEEGFLRNWGLFSDLKLRLSWGKNGNQAFGNYQQYPSYAIGEGTAQYQFGNDYVTTIRPGAADRGIKWEATTSYNIGLDFGLADNRFTGAIDYYHKKTNDLIFRVPVAAGTFTSNFITTNIGSLENRGLEFLLSAVIAEGRGGGFSWTADFNASTNANKILEINPYGGAEAILTGAIGGAVGNEIQVLQPGSPRNAFYVYEHKLDANGKPLWSDENSDGTIDETDIYVDQNSDGIVNQDDRVAFHSPDPTWSFGHSSRFGWGNFDASFTLRAYLGNYVYNNVASNFGHYRALSYVGAPNNLHASVLETGFEREQYFSNYYVENASLLRMDNLAIGYTLRLPAGHDMRIFAVVQNVFTLTGYSGVDPLAGVNGIDNNLYPRSRTFTGGLSVRF
ncbi:MAG TPA: SusC/RagA family TonB-linked outer membrane protein [Gemmatimonadales bacterium]|jgi:iron complex outermembrane receptor protein